MTKTAVFSAIALLAFSALPASAQTSDRQSSAQRAAAIQNSPARDAMAAQPAVPADPAAVNPWSWSGFYFGAGWGREKKSLDQGTAYQTLVPGGPGQPSNEPVRLDSINYLNRGHILGGYLWQYERFLLGAEGDYSFGDRVPASIPFGPEPGYCGVGTTGNYICGSPTSFGSVETRGHLRGVAGLPLPPN